MKYLYLALSLVVLLLCSCSGDKEKVTLQPGTPSYAFAKDLSSVVPAVDPDSNKVIIETNTFSISTGEVIDVIFTNFGPRSSELKNLAPDRIKSVIEMNAEGITVTDAQVDSLLEVQYQKVGGEDVFQNYIAKNGVTIEYVKKDIANGFIVSKYMERIIMDESGISEKELMI